jgi:nucleoside-diphosphate-sugar epimerase
MPGVLITGATGFVGSTLVPGLLERHYRIHATYHGQRAEPWYGAHPHLSWMEYDLYRETNDYVALLNGIDTVIHLAARVHAPVKGDEDIDSYIKLNRMATHRLATEAAERGVRRFVFLSTIKVNCEKTAGLDHGLFQRFTENDPPRLVGPYAISKYEAEQSLIELCRRTGMEYVILRPPLIYGPRVKSNFLRLLNSVSRGMPLPLGSLNNRRSLIYVENLSHAIYLCIESKAAADQVYLISDYDMSVPDLIREMARCLGRPPRLFPVPITLLKLAGTLPRCRDIIDRLTESLLIDNTKITHQLGWTPPVELHEGIMRTVAWYQDCHRQ